MPNLDNQDDGVGLDRVNHTIIADSEASGSFQAVAEGFPKFHRMRGELCLDSLLDSALVRYGKTRNIYRDDAFQILNSIFQAQALLWGIRFCLVFNRSSAIREKWRSS